MEDLLRNTINEKVIENSIVNKLTHVHATDNATCVLTYLDFKLEPPKLLIDDKAQVLGLSPHTKFVQLGTLQVSSMVNEESNKALEVIHNVDTKAMVMNVIISEMAHSINKNFMNKLDELCTTSYLKRYTRKDRFLVKLYSLFKKKYVKKIKVHNDRELIMRMMGESNRIASTGRFGPGNFVICGLKTATILETNSQYTFTPKTETFPLKNSSGIYALGVLGGMTIYVDPNMLWDDKNVYIGRNSSVETEMGIHFIYMPQSTDYNAVSQVNQETGIKETKQMLRFRCAMVPVGMFPENNYSKFIYKEKDPWIRISIKFRKFRNKALNIGTYNAFT